MMQGVTDVASYKMADLLAAYPGAGDVLARHGVDPRTRCHRAATNFMTLKQVLGRTCPVDDVAATLADLEELIEASDASPAIVAGTTAGS